MARSRFFSAVAFAAFSVAVYSSAVAQTIVVGSKEFTEQLLVAEMTTQLLRARGYSVHKGTGFATTGLRTLQESGVIRSEVIPRNGAAAPAAAHVVNARTTLSTKARAISPLVSRHGLKIVTSMPTARPLASAVRKTVFSSCHDRPSGNR